MKIKLKDAIGAEEFIRRVVDTASTMAFCFAHENDDKVMAELERMRAALTNDIARNIGAESAENLADWFIRAVMGEKHRLEGHGVGTA